MATLRTAIHLLLTYLLTVAPTGFCNRGEVRYWSRVQSPPEAHIYCSASGICRVWYLSCHTKKFHDNESTHILHNFGTSTHRGEASPLLRPLAAPLLTKYRVCRMRGQHMFQRSQAGVRELRRRCCDAVHIISWNKRTHRRYEDRAAGHLCRGSLRYDTIRDAVLTCARKLTYESAQSTAPNRQVISVKHTKTEKLKSKNGYAEK